MGQGSSQPVNAGFTDDIEDNDVGDSLENHSNDTTPRSKERSTLQQEDAPKSKRKRKSSPITTNPQKQLPVVSASSPSQPQNEQDSRPMKRKRTSESAQKKKGRTAADVPTLGVGNKNAAMEVVDIQPSEDPERQNGKRPSKPKASPASRPQEKAAPVIKPTINESKTTSPSLPPESSTSTPAAAQQKPARSNKGGTTGFFTSDEVQALESFKLKFCNTHLLSGDDFDTMVQHSERDKGTPFPCEADVISKQEFWRNIYETIPNRDRRSTYRFMRRHFQPSTQKPHSWTKEQDNELVSLHTQHGPKFAYIAKLLGRSDDDVVQRWKNRLEHRETMRRGQWSEEEVRSLQKVLDESRKNLSKAGHDVGKDIYEMDESLIGWGQVSDKINNCRSRQQCADKWRKIRRKVLTLRHKGNPNAIYNPTSELQSPKKKSKSPAVTVAAQSQLDARYKSSEFVNSDDSEEDDSAVASQSPKKATPFKQPKSIPKENKSTAVQAKSKTSTKASKQPTPSEDKSSSEEESGSGSGSESDSESESEDDAASKSKTKTKTSLEKAKDPANGIDSQNSPQARSKNAVKEKSKETQDKHNDKAQSKDKGHSKVQEKAAPAKPVSQKQNQAAQRKQQSSVNSSSESDSESESESEDDTDSESEQPAAKSTSKSTPKAPKNPTPPSQDGESDSQDSSSDNDSSNETDSSSEESDDNEPTTSSSNDDDNKPTETITKPTSNTSAKRKNQQEAQPGKQQHTKRPKIESSPDSSLSDSSDSSDSSSSESESESESEADTKPNPKSINSRPKSKGHQSPPVKSRQSSTSDASSTNPSRSSSRNIKGEAESDSELDVKPRINTKGDLSRSSSIAPVKKEDTTDDDSEDDSD